MNKEIREPAVAGAFYPDSPSQLAKMIAEMLAKTQKISVPGEIMGLVAPHAGYVYSGPVAAYAYKAIQGAEYKDVIVISPSHYEAFDGAAVYPGDAYRTPLGDIPVDKELSSKIASQSALVQLSERGHRPTFRGGEHSLEVELPFLQTMLSDFRLVAIVMGDQDIQTCRALAESIAQSCGDRDDVLIVASSDLSHFHKYSEAVSLDDKVTKLVGDFDYSNLYNELQTREIEACGGGPIVSAMIACEKMGAASSRVLKYGNSGDITKDSSSVVGYMAAVFYKADKESEAYEIKDEDSLGDIEVNPASSVDFGLTDYEKKMLLELAYQPIAAHLEGREPSLDSTLYQGVLAEDRGAFVTLTIDGNLRGCIGYIKAVKPLYKTVAEMAVQAAFYDPRFPPLTKSELKLIDIEISVLTPMTLVNNPQDIVVGRDGLYIIRGYNSGLLLPQVPVENDWDRETFLDQVCLKAGLAPGTWKSKGTQLYKFQADIFGGK